MGKNSWSKTNKITTRLLIGKCVRTYKLFLILPVAFNLFYCGVPQVGIGFLQLLLRVVTQVLS